MDILMQRPSAVIHMALWGTASGIITALVYLLLLIGVFGADFEPWNMFILANLYGGVPGAVLGVIDGLIIHSVLNDETVLDLDYKRQKAQTNVATMTFLGMLLFLGIAISPMLFIYLYVSFVPPILAMVAAVYATKRYFVRLAELNGLKAKLDEKAQNDARIERLALKASEQQQALASDFSRSQKAQHRR
jgi:hypothetical protein